MKASARGRGRIVRRRVRCRPEPAEHRGGAHRIASRLHKLWTVLQPRAKRALHAMMYAESRAVCEQEIAGFVERYGAKYLTTVTSLTTDETRLMRHFDYPADH